ncbi:hypothetical protein ACF07Q_27845 [Nocardiopsis dassonvillei]|uniref:hypothetical protein n=1 Tax=Nocardiopsis dassonvillei TaxID=2014 RepID=UPI0036F79E95
MADEVRMTEEAVPVSPLPDGVRAVVRYPEDGERPTKRGRLNVSTVFLVAAEPPEDFTPPDDIDPGDIAWVLEKPARRLKSARDRWGARADELLTAWIPG